MALDYPSLDPEKRADLAQRIFSGMEARGVPTTRLTADRVREFYDLVSAGKKPEGYTDAEAIVLRGIAKQLDIDLGRPSLAKVGAAAGTKLASAGASVVAAGSSAVSHASALPGAVFRKGKKKAAEPEVSKPPSNDPPSGAKETGPANDGGGATNPSPSEVADPDAEGVREPVENETPIDPHPADLEPILPPAPIPAALDFPEPVPSFATSPPPPPPPEETPSAPPKTEEPIPGVPIPPAAPEPTAPIPVSPPEPNPPDSPEDRLDMVGGGLIPVAPETPENGAKKKREFPKPIGEWSGVTYTPPEERPEAELIVPKSSLSLPSSSERVDDPLRFHGLVRKVPPLVDMTDEELAEALRGTGLEIAVRVTPRAPESPSPSPVAPAPSPPKAPPSEPRPPVTFTRQMEIEYALTHHRAGTKEYYTAEEIAKWYGYPSAAVPKLTRLGEALRERNSAAFGDAPPRYTRSPRRVETSAPIPNGYPSAMENEAPRDVLAFAILTPATENPSALPFYGPIVIATSATILVIAIVLYLFHVI